MGITCKPVGKMRSIMRKIENEILKEKQEEKLKKKEKNNKNRENKMGE